MDDQERPDPDADINWLSLKALGDEVKRLRDGIRSHRDQRGDDRCWLDDEKLYGLLPEGVPARTHMDFELMYPNCKRFLETRVHPRDRFAWGETPGGSMYPTLEQAERELPSLLMVRADWQSVLIDDEAPNVLRLWMPYGEGRLMLHVIRACDEREPLYHPHPWPSAMVVKHGCYETAYGHGPPDGPAPPKGPTRIVGPGERYEMVNPEAWHYVRPLSAAALTVMVTGKPWGGPRLRKGRDLAPLDEETVERLLATFRAHYPLTKKAG